MEAKLAEVPSPNYFPSTKRENNLYATKDSAKNNLDFLIRNCTTDSAHFLFSKSSHSQLCCGFENKKSTESVAHLRQKLSKLFLAEF
jgi:hypothetical protein